ncbi:hypothetical protein FD27_GL000861 [Limosilactobacillus frumenti DSM 13145]|uniref:Uncharacterized protein n=1 Tax=Limosilactobacillus frumenti DSM 13145 TaxID=1423746 RepID=A0A0R1P3D3_9LACO|nr:hypothetical protein [Limosilactobacillus frumenti]KRL27111.1 hypothetical protein FD27_GL000861 [Limosilactobacillus frumenti DSM 13145]MBA2913799.1 hypothetical protein [Limosilactobacillus frumenti]QFG72580.1 hypothetical protein LF145_04160 [Limosilactobacillus frumenti]
MLKEIPFHGKKVNIYKLSHKYKISAPEIRFRYEHGCRENNLVIKHINEESPYSFVVYNHTKMTIKELLAHYPHLNTLTIRERYTHRKNLVKPL